MVYVVVPEEQLLELFRLPKRAILERVVHILKECDHADSAHSSDDDSDIGNLETTGGADSRKDASSSCMESNELSPRPLLLDKEMADSQSENDVAEA